MAASFAVTAAAFLFVTPAGYAPDEPAHTAYVRHWDSTGSVPVFERSSYWPRYTAFHPPYYFASLKPLAVLARSWTAENRIRLFRTVSVVLHGLALWASFLVGRRLFEGDEAAALGSAAVVGLNPMFVYMGAAVNNEALANAAGAFLLGAVLGQIQCPSLKGMAAVGLAAGIGCGAKMSLFWPSVAAFVYLRYRCRVPVRDWFAGVVVFFGLAGPIFYRNIALYGDPLALSALYKTEPTPGGLGGLPGWVMGTFKSYWALFGWMNIPAPSWVYGVLAVLVLAAGVGLVYSRREIPSGLSRSWEWTAVFAGVVFLQGAWYGVTSLQRQGRYLFVGAAAFAPFLWLGLTHWGRRWPGGLRRIAGGSLAVFALCLSAFGLSRLAEVSDNVPGVHNPRGVR